MWLTADHTEDGGALRQASVLGTVWSTPFLPWPSPARTGSSGAVCATASNDDHPSRAAGLRGLIQRVRGWMARREVETALQEMDDYQLADIGLTRADIPAVVAGRFRRPGSVR
ncbi:DUF1127 domain-containing protein [Rhodospira trueperi]|uniref:Uncharacterized conserved protein YjiS, DUF1127 family n=1 Tax=Rhodospira trueperi TaxID=69960 RepID=A0A1G7AYA0_9PROT|nr:DUF1127 domain-containing protein [Rhodospira trueperi]SDE19692.1 Uncharacterized conserved protein YjiS, DUF1127 family [Rhodospira trueperi]